MLHSNSESSDEGFYIAYFARPSAACEIEVVEGDAPLTVGTLDVGFSWEYMLGPILHNRFGLGVQVEGANIRIFRGGRADGEAFYSFYQPAASFVPAGGSSSSLFIALPTQAVSALLQFTLGVDDAYDLAFSDMRGYRDLVTVSVQMLGSTTDGSVVETSWVSFPVHLGFGTLVQCTPESIDPATHVHCESMSAPETSACWLGQDQNIDCRWCADAFGTEEGPSLCRRYFCGLGD